MITLSKITSVDIQSVDQLYCNECAKQYADENESHELFDRNMSKANYDLIIQFLNDKGLSKLPEIYDKILVYSDISYGIKYYSTNKMNCKQHNFNRHNILKYLECASCFDCYYKIAKLINLNLDQYFNINKYIPDHICNKENCELLLKNMCFVSKYNNSPKPVDHEYVMQQLFYNRTKSARNI